ncbi:MAG: antibiotic biosynthesis monooxygenase [Caulobacteraceae bacterium]|nr:antibiotic biosynthesis monooxygenase [Caulobacteraceae bacterium]
MTGIVATLKVQDGKGPEFEAIFKELTAEVRAGEPGTLFYQLLRSSSDPNTYKVLEVYKSGDAFQAHMQGAPFKTLFPKVLPLLDGKPVGERFDVCE